MWDSILDVAMEYLGRQQDRLMADFPLGDWQRYDYGQEAGTLTFSSNGRIGIVADIQVVTPKSGGTWLWAWDNPVRRPDEGSGVR